jgi:UDP-N-acetylglucosamine acyltransferase
MLRFKWPERLTGIDRRGVHPTAVIGDDVTLERGVTVGAYCVLGGRVKIDAGTSVLHHSTITGTTFIGSNCRLGPYAAVGTDPQHHGYDGRETYLIVGNTVTVREFATLHRATSTGIENATRVGNGCLLMVGSHVAHDCRVGNNVTMANGVHLGGHVVVGDRAFIGGATVVHQFCRVGRLAMIGGGEAMSKDVMPFGAVFRNRHKGYNAVGCRRAGLDFKTVKAIRSAFVLIHSKQNAIDAADELLATGGHAGVPEVMELIEFIKSTRRGIQPGAVGAPTDTAD